MKKVKIKPWIDYLFWKRTWFRLAFIMFPIFPAGVSFLFCWATNSLEYFRETFGLTFLFLFVIGMEDNDNMDGCDKPLKEDL